MIKLEITLPSENTGFVENKRSFCVEGNIISDEILNDNCELIVNVLDSNNNVIRYAKCDRKHKDMYLLHPDLVRYKDDLDPNLDKLKEFGFPLLVVDDINNPLESLHKATIKAWYSDNKFKAIIVNASNTESGAIVNDGFDLRDDDGNPYSLLSQGKYYIEVILKNDNNVLAKTNKEFIIGERHEQLICRFNPENHKKRMRTWIMDKEISMIDDLLPGYLDPYLGKWYYHMGLLKMYRANDLCLFENAHITMFDYLIDETSTSYATELAYLQNNNAIDNRVDVYYYDIGEANIGKRDAKIIKFLDNEYGHICRIDQVLENDCENIYYLDRRNIYISHLNVNKPIEIESDRYFAIMGIIKPIQLDINDFILKEDNTYEIKDYPNIVRYTFNVNGQDIIYDRKTNMERIENNESIGKSIYEFYNVFELKKEWGKAPINIRIDCIYNKGKCVPIGTCIVWIH